MPDIANTRATKTAAVIPHATYRLQFHKGFNFDDAIRVLPYLQRLGISHVYGSPVLRAREGSMHGYDVVSHDEISPDLGGQEGFDRFCAALREHGMGQIMDIVPNHMGVVEADNPWWLDVLENGPGSAHADFFDIDWHPVNRELEGKLLLPVLGDHYGNLLDAGELQVAFDAADGSFAFRYHQHRFPLDPRSYAGLLTAGSEALDGDAGRAELRDLAASFEHLPPADRALGVKALKKRLAGVVAEVPAAAAAIDASLATLNSADKRDALHALHERQSYRLAHWRVAADEINYRRFFDVNELAALRMESAEVFEASHRLPLDFAAQGLVDGLRIDHPDGLRDPAEYFTRLQKGYAQRAGLAQDAPSTTPLYVVAEKIAAPHEDLPAGWAIHGSTGYRFAMVCNGVLVDTEAEAAFDRIWREFSGVATPFEEMVYEGKREIARHAMASELLLLATALRRIARVDRHTRDYTLNSLRDTLAEIAACMPVYRTYVMETPSAQDLHFIDWAVAQARRRSRLADLSIFDYARACLCNQPPTNASPQIVDQVRQFAQRFQQFCAPVAAKGVEDTAFYRYHRLISLNEVGGDPSVFGITPRAFHGASADRAARWPHTMVATSTHDNKRSEDVRCRIDVLSEMPDEWEACLQRWRGMGTSLRTDAGGTTLPSRADEYLLYQTLLGSLPAEGLSEDSIASYRERIKQYMQKAARESKQYTSWTRPDADYERALDAFVDGLLVRVHPNPLLSDIGVQARSVAAHGALNSLSTVLLKYTAPGVPDLYQGNEMMDLSLVDPDNRRPVDYALHVQRMAELDTLSRHADLPGQLRELLRSPHDGRAKMWTTWRLLQLHAQFPEFFRTASYEAVDVVGEQARHAIAYTRRAGDKTLLVVVGRLFRNLWHSAPVESPTWPPPSGCWQDTALKLDAVPSGSTLDNVLTGERVAVDDGALSLETALAAWPGAAFWLNAS
jgi:(1->4)-alpha-D-glucan 1-alpha-D-glucosylmutase